MLHPKASWLALVLVLALGCVCVAPCAAQAQEPNLGGELKVGLLGMGNDSWPFSAPAKGPTEPQNAGLEGFEVRGRGACPVEQGGTWPAGGSTIAPLLRKMGSQRRLTNAQERCRLADPYICAPAYACVQVALMDAVCERANLSCTAGEPAAAARSSGRNRRLLLAQLSSTSLYAPYLLPLPLPLLTCLLPPCLLPPCLLPPCPGSAPAQSGRPAGGAGQRHTGHRHCCPLLHTWP